MTVLLDTHAFLCFVLDDPQLSPAARDVIADPDTTVFVSPASYWEIAIKIAIGKYALVAPYEAFWRRSIDDNGFDVLPIEVRHTAALVGLEHPTATRSTGSSSPRRWWTTLTW